MSLFAFRCLRNHRMIRITSMKVHLSTHLLHPNRISRAQNNNKAHESVENVSF